MKLFLTHKPDLHMYSINMILLLSRPLGIQANPDDFFVNTTLLKTQKNTQS